MANKQMPNECIKCGKEFTEGDVAYYYQPCKITFDTKGQVNSCAKWLRCDDGAVRLMFNCGTTGSQKGLICGPCMENLFGNLKQRKRKETRRRKDHDVIADRAGAKPFDLEDYDFGEPDEIGKMINEIVNKKGVG